ncbi:MAG: hypothetical protein JWM91_260 [Rhodospirillales bacterium]|nr:hypothetical protein [Rhodospirillales bacterium]
MGTVCVQANADGKGEVMGFNAALAQRGVAQAALPVDVQEPELDQAKCVGAGRHQIERSLKQEPALTSLRP